MRKILLFVVFLVVLVGSAIAFTPLGFILNQSGLGNTGAGWAKVDGTLAKGRISGLYLNNQPIGDVTLKLRPMSLLGLAPTYDVQWGGAGGRGTGVITLRRNALEAKELRIQQEISALESLAMPVRAIGGTIRLTDGSVKVTRAGCESGTGDVTSNTLSRAAEQYGTQFGPLAGNLSCEGGAFLLAMAGQSEANDTLELDGEATLLGAYKLLVEVTTADQQISFALGQMGFARQNGIWVYSREEQRSLR
jgi:hypothetical protein